MYFDSHVHSKASPDSEMCPEEAILTLKKQGLGIAFTEHVDFSVENKNHDPFATDAPRCKGDFVCDFSMYPSEYRRLRGSGVALGLEFGLTAAFATENARIAAGDFDYIIGSMHFVDGVELYQAAHGLLPDEAVGGFASRFTSGNEEIVRECVRRYLEYSREMVEYSAFFDAFGHIDYIARYVPLAARYFLYGNFPSEFSDLLRALAEREIALEINTARFSGEAGGNPKGFGGVIRGAAPGAPSPEKAMVEICRRFYELGGRFCTIGSDAHNLDGLGRGTEAARRIAEESGLVVVQYKERKPIICG